MRCRSLGYASLQPQIRASFSDFFASAPPPKPANLVRMRTDAVCLDERTEQESKAPGLFRFGTRHTCRSLNAHISAGASAQISELRIAYWLPIRVPHAPPSSRHPLRPSPCPPLPPACPPSTQQLMRASTSAAQRPAPTAPHTRTPAPPPRPYSSLFTTHVPTTHVPPISP
jgi:hypothetical protein